MFNRNLFNKTSLIKLGLISGSGFLSYKLINKFFNKVNQPIKYYNINRIIKNDYWNNIPNGEYRDNIIVDNTIIGYIQYRIKTGQIGLFFIDSEYRNRGLGRQVLYNTINTIRDKNPEIKSVWAVTTQDHKFWSNVYNKSFRFEDRVHNSVTGFGYILDLETFDKYISNNNEPILPENISTKFSFEL